MSASGARRSAAALSAAARVLSLAALLPLGAAAAAPAAKAPQAPVRFARLVVEIWPEFDRPRAALVILRSELAADVALPASLSVRVPATSDPTAVAFSTAAQGELYNLEHERVYGDDFTTLRFTTAHRYLQIEFYEPLATDRRERRFAYVWPGDLAVNTLVVTVQQPAGANDLVVQPDLGAGVTGADGLLYRRAELGAFERGQRLAVELRYTKPDARTSVELLGKKTAERGASPSAESDSGGLGWLLGAAGAAGAITAAGIAFVLWRRRARAPAPAPKAAGFCTRCGNGFAAGDRFCARCGAPLKLE